MRSCVLCHAPAPGPQGNSPGNWLPPQQGIALIFFSGAGRLGASKQQVSLSLDLSTIGSLLGVFDLSLSAASGAEKHSGFRKPVTFRVCEACNIAAR